MKGLGYIGAFLGGAAAGAIIGILVAPDKGSNTREKISGTVKDRKSAGTRRTAVGNDRRIDIFTRRDQFPRRYFPVLEVSVFDPFHTI